MRKITPHLWFDKHAREAAELYVSLLSGSRIASSSTLSGTPSDDCELVSFELAGSPFLAISAGPPLKFNPSVSFHIKCSAAEQMDFYASVFRAAPSPDQTPETCVQVLARYGAGEEPGREGTVRYANFLLGGHQFAAMDSVRTHDFTFNEAISFLVPCDTQQEIDYFWAKLSEGGKAGRRGWLKDKYGVSWQITPSIMQELLAGADKQRTQRVTQSFLQMTKFDIDALTRAAHA